MDTLRILVADDEDGIRMAIARAMRTHVIDVPEFDVRLPVVCETVATGEEALEMMRDNPPDVLLLDHKLPGMSGLDVLAAIKQDDIDVTTIMITAYASLETAVVATKRGAFDFLAKPFTPDDLNAVLFNAARYRVVHERARTLAEEKKRVRFEFLSVVAHELKAPTAAVEGYLMMIRDRVLGDELADYNHQVERAMLRLQGMRKLVSDLLDLTRIESGKKRRELAMIDIRDVAELVAESGRAMGAERGIAVEIEADEPVRMMADAGEMELILNNLVSNAVKYNRDGGTVTVLLRPDDGGGVILAVRDTGIGMKPDDVTRLFGEFVRIKNDRTRRIEGSGLGLSIVKKLVDLYGGDVKVTSEWEKGTTFTITLPA